VLGGSGPAQPCRRLADAGDGRGAMGLVGR
jgi:hypothetical protein